MMQHAGRFRQIAVASNLRNYCSSLPTEKTQKLLVTIEISNVMYRQRDVLILVLMILLVFVVSESVGDAESTEFGTPTFQLALQQIVSNC